MPHPARHPAPARIARRLLLLVLLGAAATLIAPCKMIEDQMTDVSLHRDGAGACYARCAKDYAEDLVKATRRHIEALKACGDDRDCRELAREKFRMKLEELKEEARRCREDCHHQGRGGGR